MRTVGNWLWPALALLGLGLAAWGFSFGRGSAVSADGLGSGNFVMMVGNKGGNTLSERMYLVDTKLKVILVFESRKGESSRLVGGRTYDQDFAILDNHPDLKFKGRQLGYSAQEVLKTFMEEKKP